MKVFYSDLYTIPLPEGHRFPMSKYRSVRDALAARRPDLEFIEAPLATREQLLRAHSKEYVDAFLNGTLDAKAIRRLGFPWSPQLVTRSLASVGGALAAAREALRSGISGNLAGGTHHALRNAGEGFCAFNDIAVSLLTLLDEGAIQRAAVIDLDVHQGNGTADILGSDPRIFLLDLYGRSNFPFIKIAPTHAVAIEDGAGDEAYLELLQAALPHAFASSPDLIIYQSGVDPLREDTLGKLSLSFAGLQQRDEIVLSTCKSLGIPVSLALGGGYAKPIDLTIQAHVGTYLAAQRVYGHP